MPDRYSFMAHRKVLICLFVFCANSPAFGGEDAPGTLPTIIAYQTDSAIDLDGRLIEEVWLAARPATAFFQFQPKEGEPATEKTEVRVLYDDDNLYVGVMCYDDEPDRIVAQKLQRDSGLDDDDMFAFVLDTYRDRRSAYYFATNPNGVEEDGQVVDGAFSANLDWDAVWQVRARKSEYGWSAEFVIPLWNLRFKALPEQTWGINFTRIIKRKTEQVNWASWSRDNGGFLRISRAGDLANLNGLRTRLNLQIKPYVLGKTADKDLLLEKNLGDDDLDAGLDLKYAPSSNLTLDLTYNTDFAQVEGDVEQINLTRFPLFFPEKRDFFLENAKLFEFGQAGFSGPPPLLVFFSRRIGIEDFATLAPIIVGGRLTGKFGRFNVGMLDVVTDEEEEFPKTHFTVARATRDIFQRSKVGFIFTNRANFGEAHNRAYGLDANIWLSNALEFQSFLVQTYTTGTGNTDRAWKLAFDFTKDHVGGFLSHLFIDKNFDPQVGFVLRRDIRQSTVAFRVSPQPNGKFLRRTDIRQNFRHILNRDGDLRDWSYGISFNNELAGGDFVNLGYSHIFTRLAEQDTFDLRGNLQILPGDFHDNEVNASFQSSRKRKFTATANIRRREFFSGDLFNWGGGFGYAPNAHVSFSLNYGRSEIDLPQGSLNTDLIELRVNLTLNTRLFLNGLIQYNSETNDFITNVRLDFIHSPGSDLFLVFNESRGREGENFFDGLPARNRELILKLTKLLRI